MYKNIVVERVAKKIDLPEYRVNEVVNSFFELVVEDIETSNYKGSYCRRLGKFIVKPKRVEMLNNGNKIRHSGGEGGDTAELSNDSGAKETLG